MGDCIHRSVTLHMVANEVYLQCEARCGKKLSMSEARGWVAALFQLFVLDRDSSDETLRIMRCLEVQYSSLLESAPEGRTQDDP